MHWLNRRRVFWIGMCSLGIGHLMGFLDLDSEALMLIAVVGLGVLLLTGKLNRDASRPKNPLQLSSYENHLFDKPIQEAGKVLKAEYEADDQGNICKTTLHTEGGIFHVYGKAPCDTKGLVAYVGERTVTINHPLKPAATHESFFRVGC